MKSPKSPAFQFYPNDFVGSGRVAMMTPDEIGIYVLLLCLEWNDVGFELDPKGLARWCRTSPAKFAAAWRAVGECFTERDGRWFNPRLDAERAKQAEWRAKSARGGKRGAETRWGGHSDGDKGGVTNPITTVTPSGVTNASPPVSPNDDTLFPTPFPTPVTTTTSRERRGKKVPSEPSNPDVAAVIQHYRTVHPSRRGSSKDSPAAAKALERYSVEECKLAIDGNAANEWHRQEHKHELEYVLREGKIDTFIGMASGATPRRAVDENGIPNAIGAAALGMRP